MKIVCTSNDGREYPDESFLNLPPMSELKARQIANAINNALSGDDPVFFPYFWKVVPNDYKLAEPFTP